MQPNKFSQRTIIAIPPTPKKHNGAHDKNNLTKGNEQHQIYITTRIEKSRETEKHLSSIAFSMVPFFLPLHLSTFSLWLPVRGQSSTFLLLLFIVY
jgi:hypothetical protein